MAQPNARWYIKKAARHGMAVGSWASGSLALRRTVRRAPGVRALTYHRIGDDPHDPFCVSSEVFEAQMRLLAEQGRAVSLEQLRSFVAGRKALPEDACLVTIDDGMLSTLTEALPILRRWHVPAVAFVSSDLIGRKRIEGLAERYMTWQELREVAESGVVSVGSHAHTHRSLGLMSPADAYEEARKSREVLQEKLDREVMSFTYPFGTRTDFNDTTDQALARAGYSLAFNSMHGAIRQGMNPISLPRVKIEGGESLFVFSLISRGAMDPWRMVDQNLWRFQRVRTEIA